MTMMKTIIAFQSLVKRCLSYFICLIVLILRIEEESSLMITVGLILALTQGIWALMDTSKCLRRLPRLLMSDFPR